MKFRRWKPQETDDKKQERWLLTYSDLITLLLILFVLFYAMSKIDDSRYESIAKALQLEFKKDESIIPLNPSQIIKKEPAKTSQKDNKTTTELDLERLQEQERKLKESLAALESFIKKNKLEKNITFQDTPRGISITLKDLFLFDIGKAELKKNAYPLLDELAKVFRDIKNKISIEGHTDNQVLAPVHVLRTIGGYPTLVRSQCFAILFTKNKSPHLV